MKMMDGGSLEESNFHYGHENAYYPEASRVAREKKRENTWNVKASKIIERESRSRQAA